LLVVVDYFTKWPEVKPLATITGKQVVKFVCEQIVCRFGLPGKLISDNGTQFAGNPFKSWCTELQITQIFTSVAHPQSNGQVERMNRSIVEGIKERLGGHGKRWLEELPSVLWAIRTTEKTSHGHTPYILTYGSEAVIPAEIGIPTHRTKNVSEETNDEELMANLALADERRDTASINEARYKKKMDGYHNQRVRHYDQSHSAPAIWSSETTRQAGKKTRAS
jgi:transposase InsO family protein